MKLRFFESEHKAYIIDDATGEVAALVAGIFEALDHPLEFYEEVWSRYIRRPSLTEYLESRRPPLKAEDFTEVDSYGNPLQDAA